MRAELIIGIDEEINLTNQIGNRLLEDGYNASNSVIITVSTDYSSIPGQLLRHRLSHNLEICEGIGIDVPYPDEEWDSAYVTQLHKALTNNRSIYTKTLILVEAGVIRGGNYTFVANYLRSNIGYSGKIITVALFENEGSKWKSDYVGRYYDNMTQDLTFIWEKPNKHWSVGQ
jgi:hypothetical protein